MFLLSWMKALLALSMGAFLVDSRRSGQLDDHEDTLGISSENQDNFKCPRSCNQCCMAKEGFRFECYFKRLFASRANLFRELGGYPCNRSKDMTNDAGVFTVCDLTDDAYPGAFQKNLKRLDKQIEELDSKLSSLADTAEEPAPDPLSEEIAQVVSEIEELQKAKEGSAKIFDDLNDEIGSLKKLLRDGELLPPKQQSLIQIQAAESSKCVPVSDAGPLMVKQRTDEIQKKKQEIAETEEEREKSKLARQGAQAAAQEKLKKVKREKADLLNDPVLKEVSPKIASLKEQKKRLQDLVEKGFPAHAHKLLQLKISATRNADFVQLLLRLRNSQSGKAGKDRQDEFMKHVAPYAGTTIEDDEAKLKRFCKIREKVDKDFTCSSVSLRKYFKKLNKDVTIWKESYSDVIDKVVEGQNPDDPNTDAIVEVMPRVKETVEELWELITSWQFVHLPRFNEPLWMKYLNWVEDSESAVRVYLKVTNREYNKGNASNSLIACAEQRHDLEYHPDRMVRISDCSEKPPWEHKLWNSTLQACSKPEAWDDAHRDRTFGPFFGVYASSDEAGKRGMENNIPNADVYGYNKDVEDIFEWAPTLEGVLKQAQSGYTIVLFGYGYSGTGKTFTLLGKDKRPGILTLGLEAFQDSIRKMEVRFKELYGQISLEDGRPEVGETGLYSYKVALGSDSMPVADVMCPDQSASDCVDYKFWGRSDAKQHAWAPRDLFVPPKSDRSNPSYKPQSDEVVNLGFADFLEMPEHIIKLDKNVLMNAGWTIGEWLQAALAAIQRTRETQRCRSLKGDEGCRHVRATPNNPTSSRGHLFTMMDVTFKAHADDVDQSDKVGKIIIVDCAGSEDPVSIMKDYVDFAADGQPAAIGDRRAATYLKEYDRQHAGKLKLWNSLHQDAVTPSKKKRAWLVEAAKAWAQKLPADITIGKKKYKAGESYVASTSSGHTSEDQLLKTWSEKYLLGAGIISMVKEGVFINESLNHLKQFLLKRSGRIKSLMQTVTSSGLKPLSDDVAKVPGTSDPVLPFINDWDFEKGHQPRFHCNGRPNKHYDPVINSYHPKQFIKPWNTRRVGETNFKPKKEATNTESLLGSSRCSYSWASDPLTPDQAGRPFSCDTLQVDGVKAKRRHLSVGAIPRFDPVMMTSMLNYFDHPEYFGRSENAKPTKFLMLAAVRREHPEDKSAVPHDHTPESFKRLKRNICMGAELTLTFADEMNPLSKNNRLELND